jgi:hypothetical protein
MGVGVYSSNFNGSGGTFVVDGIVGGEDEYRKYVLENIPADVLTLEQWRTDIADDPDADEDDYKDYLYELAEEDSLDLNTWQQDQDDAFVEDFEHTILSAARELGMSGEGSRDGRYDRARFDTDFVSMATGRYIDIGWRSWEHDMIVGIAGSSMTHEWACDPEVFAGEILDNTGLSSSRFSQIYGGLSEAVQAYVRLSLMRDGKECSYKTSGYTTSVYEAPEEGFDAALEALRGKIRELQKSIPESFHDGIVTASQCEREEIVHAVASGGVNFDTPIVLPLYDPEQGKMVLYSNDRKRFITTEELPSGFIDAVQDMIAASGNSDDFIALPLSDDLSEAWSDLQSQHPDHFIVSMDEWIGVVGGDPAIEWRDASGQEWEANVILPARDVVHAP